MGNLPCKRVPDTGSGHAAGHQAYEVASTGFGLQLRVNRARGLKRPNQISRRLEEAGTFGVC